MARLPKFRITGPLTPHAQGLWNQLLAEGYTALSALNLLRLLAHLSRWMAARELEIEDLTDERIEAFVADRRAHYTNFRTRHALEPLWRHLLEVGAPQAVTVAGPRSAIDVLVDDYGRFLSVERALTPSAVAGYCTVAKRFLAGCFGDGAPRPDQLTSGDLTAFILGEVQRYQTGTVKLTVTALRSLIRYLHVRGDMPHDLSGALPAIAGWRLQGLPRALEASQLRQLLKACDRRTHVGRRDYAVLLLLARLGLRAGEVAALELDDLAWDRGELRTRGKGQQQDTLPLPNDVGTALASYLRFSRPRSRSRHVFLRVCAPTKQLTTAAVTSIVRNNALRAGLAPIGSHCLRHTAATQMLRKGGSLDEIAQVLRHRSQSTTAIYAKVDRLSLRQVAQPWPGVTP